MEPEILFPSILLRRTGKREKEKRIEEREREEEKREKEIRIEERENG